MYSMENWAGKTMGSFYFCANQGLLYTRTDFLPKEVAEIRLKPRFSTNKSGVTKTPCVI